MRKMDLVGIHAKLLRAEHQLKQITNEANWLCSDVQHGIVREVREDVDKQVWVYRGEVPNAPISWSVIFGEILYNLRSALDHLVWQLVLVNGQTPGRHNAFPITNDAQGWEKIKDNLLNGVSSRHKSMISYLQPYIGGMYLPFDVSKFKLLDDLSNIEKHRYLIVAFIASMGPANDGILGIDPPELVDSSVRAPFEGLARLGKIKNGKELLEFNNSHIEASSPSFQIALCFADKELMYSSAPNILAQCLRTVRGTIDFLTTPMGSGFVEAPGRT